MKALYAGSFDPFTNGHLSIVKEASLVFDEAIVCIASNAGKNRYTHVEAMKCAIEQVLCDEGISNASVCICDCLVADLCRERDVQYLVRGLRNTTDYLYEENIAKINNTINPELKTIYFRAKDDVISSSMVRELLKYGKDISIYVPVAVQKLMRSEE